MRWQLSACLCLGIVLFSVVGRADDSAVEPHLKGLKSKDVATRIKAARSLGVGGEKAVPALIEALSDADPGVRLAAAQALGRIGPAAKDAAPALIKAIFDKDVTLRRAARSALRDLQAPSDIVIPVFVKMLEEAEPAEVIGVVSVLAEEGERAVPAMVKALKHERACYWACLVLAEMGEKAQAAVPDLIEVLKHKDSHVRLQALQALGKIGPAAKSATEAIGHVVQNDTVAGVRYVGMHALGLIGDVKALPVAQAGLEDQDAFLKVISAWAVLQLDAENPTSVEQGVQIILAGLNSYDANVRAAAVKAIEENKAPAEAMAPALVDALDHGDEEFVTHVISAMASLGEKMTPRVIRGLQNPKLRTYAIRVVIEMGPRAKGTVATLLELLKLDNVELRREVHFALGAIGPGAAPAVPALIEALSDKQVEIRNSASYALGRIGPAAKAGIPALRKHVNSEDTFSRLASVWALLKIQPGNAELTKLAVPLLIKALSDERELVRAEVATSLGELGVAAKDALVPLQKVAAEDSSLMVRAAAAEAVTKLK